jgi:hypothetical protein
MTRRYMLGAYWGSRKEDAKTSAKRLRSFLGDLADCDPALATWFERGGSLAKALKSSIPHADEDLVGLLERHQNRRDVGGNAIDELGFQLGLWNGSGGLKGVGLSITCGLYWHGTGSGSQASNYVVLDLPTDLGQLARFEHMIAVLKATVLAWEPNWAGVWSKNSARAMHLNTNKPFVDWMLYVPCRVHNLVEPSVAIDLPGRGSLVVVQPDPTTGDDSAELARIHKVEESLCFSREPKARRLV